MDKTKLVKYSFFNLPKFGRTTLEPVKRFSELIGNPHKTYKSIHIAGTNGKGTVSYKLAKIMQNAGFKTGLFISPHLVKFNERISIDGEDISDDNLFRIENELCKIYEEQADKPDLVIFDMITMIAFKYFQEEKVDYAIVEVGIGGTIDPTNIITPEVSVITSIGYDHMQILGDTLEKISSQKLGICKPDVPAVIGPDWPQTFMKEHIKNDMGLNLDLISFMQYTHDTKSDYQLENTEIVK